MRKRGKMRGKQAVVAEDLKRRRKEKRSGRGWVEDEGGEGRVEVMHADEDRRRKRRSSR